MHIPISTYRLQFNKTFGFKDALNIVQYLYKLGVTDLYASPIMKAVKGSMHGYDVTEPSELNPELGEKKDFNELISTLKNYNMNWVQDFVPNHMAFSPENRMLVDLLENGPNSRYFDVFDIEWNHPFRTVNLRLLAPFLGKFYQYALAEGELVLKFDEEGFSINYYERRLPIKMESYSDILSYRISRLRNKLGRNNADFIKYQGVLYVLKSLPSKEEMDERYSQIKFLKGLLWEMYSASPDIKEFLDENIKIYNGEKGNAESFNLLDKLLNDQYFRLSYWKVANEEINYRRFFNINELISLKMEHPQTFDRVHQFILKFVEDGDIKGLRIDHVDGLYDPTAYLKRLRDYAPNAYIVVEKILELEEELPSFWPIEGTTGYEFMNFLNGIFVQTKNQRVITSSYQRFTKEIRSFEEIVHEKKRLIIQARMAGDVERLSFIIEAISSRDRNGVDITMHGIKKALEEILTYFPIYRTYIDENHFSKRDKKYLDDIMAKVKEQNPSLTDEFNYIGNLLTLNFGEHFSKEQAADTYDFIKKFQQLTGPLMAKGFEDTALYVYNRFLSLNEVGGNPGKFGMNIKEFHNFNKARSAKWPHTMNGSSTHDTKLSEDVRARINAISEFAQEWDANIKSWNKINQIQKKKINGRYVPDNNEEYRIYQILLGSFPQDAAEHEEYLQRIKEYIVKSLREAKQHSTWIKPNAEYESAAQLFAETILKNPADDKFLTSFMQFKNKIAFYGMFNSLSQVLLKAASPGLPDFYQGTDLWSFSLVDPDNRRPVDYGKRNKFLDEIVNIKSEETGGFIEKMFDNLESGQIKLFLTYKCLQARKQHPDLFQHGNYIPLHAGGALSENIAAFARAHENKTAVVVAPRFYSALIKPGNRNIDPEIFKDTYLELPEGFNYMNVITSEAVNAKREVPLSLILAKFPGALLIGEKI